MGRALRLYIAAVMALSLSAGAFAQGAPATQMLTTPPRLSLVDGPTSFWRPGAEDWVPARINTPLAAGDSIYTDRDGNMEIQIGPRAFIRAGGGTQLQIADIEPDYLQIKVGAGEASLDLRQIDPGRTLEVATPYGAFTIQRVGYYRFSVTPDSVALITRRGGNASLTLSNGQTMAVNASEEVIVPQDQPPAVYAAPDLDAWDTWNYQRTDYLVDSMSARYVPAGVYGASDLDHNGSWRTVPEYGAVWFPTAVPAGWAPYTTGHWVYDPVFGWTWIDDEPWGWAPFHYGRWVSIHGYWAWCPGPATVHPVYSPALVAWLGGAPGASVSIGVGVGIGWVALGWGEPVMPWWGPHEIHGRPYWGGWGGPRVINNTVVKNVNITNINVTNITYANTRVNNAVVATSADRFGHTTRGIARIPMEDVRKWHPAVHGIEVKPTAASLVPGDSHGVRPPAQVIERPVVATRPSREPLAALRSAGIAPVTRPEVTAHPAPTIVVPHTTAPGAALQRPTPGNAARFEPGPRSGVPGQAGRPGGQVRPSEERRPPPATPSFNAWREQQRTAPAPGNATAPGAAAPPRVATVPPPHPQTETAVPAPSRPGGFAPAPSRPGGGSFNAAPMQPTPRAPAQQGGFAERRNLPGEPAMQMRPQATPRPPAEAPQRGAPPANVQRPAAPAQPSHPGNGGARGREQH